MMKSKIKLSRYRITVMAVWAVCFVAIVAGYGLLYAPQKIHLSQMQTRYQQNQTELEQAQLAALPKTREKIELRSDEAARLIERFSTERDGQTELVFQIGQIAADLKLDEFSSKYLKAQSYPTVGQSKIISEGWLNVEFFASFAQFSQFINRLERNCPVVFIEEVDFRRGKQDGKDHDVVLRLSYLTTQEKTDKAVATAVK